MTSPIAVVTPSPWVPGMTASVRVAKAKTTVTFEARMAGIVCCQALLRAARSSSVVSSSSR